MNEVGREEVAPYYEQEEYGYEADGYYGDEDYLWAEEDEEGNVYYYYPQDEMEYEEVSPRQDPEARGAPAKTSDAPAVGSVGAVINSTATQEEGKGREQPKVFHLL